MKEQDKIKELFSEKLGNYQAPVRPELWANISSQIASTTAVSAGISVITKTIIGFGLVASTVTAIILYVNRPLEENNKTPKTELVPSTKDKLVKANSTEVVDTDNIVMSTTIDNPQTSNTNNNRLDFEVDLSEMGDVEPISFPEVSMNYQNEGNQQSHDDGAGLNNEGGVINETGTSNEANDNSGSNSQGEELGAFQETPKPEIVNEIVLPNIFSPNGDGSNDRLEIKCDGLKDFNVVVLNKFNQTVYQSKDPNFSWDGTGFNGLPVDSGNYVYFIIAVDAKGSPVNQHCTLSIVR